MQHGWTCSISYAQCQISNSKNKRYHKIPHERPLRCRHFQCNWSHSTKSLMASSNGNISALLALWRGIHMSPVNSPPKGQWRRALMFSLISAWTNGCVNNRDAADLRRHLAHYDVTVMMLSFIITTTRLPHESCSIALEEMISMLDNGKTSHTREAPQKHWKYSGSITEVHPNHVLNFNSISIEFCKSTTGKNNSYWLA